MMFRSEELPPGDQLAALDEIFQRSAHPMRLVSDAPEDFQATVRMLDIAAVNVVELTSSPSEVLRTPKLVRQADPELYSVILPLHGELVVSQAGRDAVLNAHDLALYSSSQPFRLQISTKSATTVVVRAHIHRALLNLPADRIDRLLARRLSGRTGVGSLLVQYLAGMTTGAAAYLPTDLPRLGTIAQDLLTAVLAHYLDTDAAIPDCSRRRSLLLRIETFVQQHLHDPSLSPEAIAHAHHISLSYLHRLFSARGTTMAAWIRHQRLERARRDLTDPALRTVSVHRIATRWGFNDHSTFTRAFRAVYGVPPKDYRHQTLAKLTQAVLPGAVRTKACAVKRCGSSGGESPH